MSKKNLSNLIHKYKETGICEIYVDKVVDVWDDDWGISQYHEEFKLCHNNPKADNFTRTDFKIVISKQQAHELIGKMNLIDERSTVFNHGRIWKLNKPSNI